MHLKGIVYPNMLNEENRANSSTARSSQTFLDSISDLSWVPSVSPLNSKAGCALSLQGYTWRTIKLAATNLPLVLTPFIKARSSFTCSMLALFGASNQVLWLSRMWSVSKRMAGWLYFI